MSDRLRVSSLMPKRLQEQGLSVPVVLQRAGLPSRFFQQEKITASTEELFALWRAIAETSRDPAIGLKLGADERVEHYSPTRIAAVCSRSLRDALERIARFKRLTCPEEVRVRGSRAEVSIEFLFTEAEDNQPEVLVDSCLSWIAEIAHRGTGGSLVPLRLELRRRESHRALLERHFGCGVRFHSRRNALVFTAEAMDRPFVTHNDDLLKVVHAQLEAELTDQEAQRDEDVVAQVAGALKRSLAGKKPTIQSVAQEVGTTERTLQRRLADAGSSFQRVAEAVRRELACHYLSHSNRELHEVAFLVGYENANSFFRAFHQWEGTTPGEWRQRTAGGTAKARGSQQALTLSRR